jgi:hypothetical protein
MLRAYLHVCSWKSTFMRPQCSSAMRIRRATRYLPLNDAQIVVRAIDEEPQD